MANESRPAGAASELIAASKTSVSQTTVTGQEARRFQPMPELTTEQYDALKADISLHGIVVPIVVDQYDRVLDGHNRFRIAAELKIDCPREVHHVVDDDEAADLAVTLNCARRHLTREQVREVIAGELTRRPGDSDRAIARRVGCDHKTVGAVRSGEVPQVPKLDTTTMTRDEALRSTAKAKKAMVGARDQLVFQAITALTNKISAAEIVMAFTAVMRSMEVDGMDTEHVLRDYVFTPVIDWLMDPQTTEEYRAHWDHELFLPLAEADRQNLLAMMAGAR